MEKRSGLLSCLFAIGITILAGACTNSNAKFPDRPTSDPMLGFDWEIVRGAGLKFWSQSNASTRILPDSSIPGAVLESANGKRRTVMRIFHLPDRKIENIVHILREKGEWNDSVSCAFRQIESPRKGVARYVMVPAGEEAEIIEKEKENEAITSTCCGWGIGNSGMRYFEIHASHPDKAIFIEIGQEMPLFDPESIVLQ